MQYKPDVARLSTIHSPTLEPGTHDVSYHLPSNPSSPFSSRKSTFIFAFSKILSLFYSPEKTLSFHFKCLLWRIPFNISKIQSWTKMLRKMHVICLILEYFPLKPGSLKILPLPPKKQCWSVARTFLQPTKQHWPGRGGGRGHHGAKYAGWVSCV